MIPVFANPGKRRGKKKRGRRHGGGIARACRAHGLKGRWRRRASRKTIRGMRAKYRAYKKRRVHHKRKRQSLTSQLSHWLGLSRSGSYQGAKIAKIHRKMAAVAKRQAKIAARKERAAAGFGSGLGGGYTFSNPGRRHMRRHHRFNPPSAAAGITAGFRPSNLTGVLPIIGGAVLNGIARRFLGSKVPMLSSGLPGLAAGIATAGIVGAAVGYIRPGLGQRAFLGGMVETLSDPFASAMKKIGLGGFDMGADWSGANLAGFGDFADPRQVQQAAQFGSDMSQYPFPVNQQQVAPMSAHGAHYATMPQHAAEAQAVSATMADYDISSM